MQHRRGFVFSLDAFVSFSLILIAIQSIIIVSSAPAGYWQSLLQAEYLAKDTLHVISNTYGASGASVLGDSSAKFAAGVKFSQGSDIITVTNRLVPKPYSYSYHYYDIATGKWTTLYNASTDSPPTDPHFNVTYHRVSASAEQLMMDYSSPTIRPQSPYCNVMCHGWDPTLASTSNPFRSTDNCTQTPCSAMPSSNFQVGNLSFGLIRLTVWG